MQHSPGFLALVEAAKRRILQIDAAAMVALLRSDPQAVLIDVREDHEWRAGHVQGAVHLGRGILERDIESRYPQLDTPLYLYCGGGFRSALAADNLRQMGYSQVYSVDGGWRELQQLLPVEAEP